jgi:hypothetical protein
MEAEMETFETTTHDDDGPPPPVPGREQAGPTERSASLRWKASPRVRSTRGGSGAAAGSTPKKEHRPGVAGRHRPAGKKPDAGPR